MHSAVGTTSESGTAYTLYERLKNLFPASVEEKFTFAAPLLYPPRTSGIPWNTRREMYRYGFKPRAYYIYDFDRYGIESYLSDRNKHGGELNEPLSDHLKNKLKFHKLFDEHGFEAYLPELYGVVEGGHVSERDIDFVSLLESEGALVVKGKRGFGGYNVSVLKYQSDEYYVDNAKRSVCSLRQFVDGLDGCLVTEYCEQAAYAEDLYSETSNTIRLVAIDPEDRDPFSPVSVHRIGTEASGHVDNCSQGGLTAEIKQDGELSAAGQFEGYDVSWYDRHPDTNSLIEGTTVPRWPEICDKVLSITEEITELQYVGWDIIITSTGEFKIIEGNNRTDVDLLQIHQPLLAEDRTRAFFERHGLA